MIKWFDSWQYGDTFKRVQEDIQEGGYIHSECGEPLIHIYYRGFTTLQKAKEIARKHNSQAEFLGDRGVERVFNY